MDLRKRTLLTPFLTLESVRQFFLKYAIYCGKILSKYKYNLRYVVRYVILAWISPNGQLE